MAVSKTLIKGSSSAHSATTGGGASEAESASKGGNADSRAVQGGSETDSVGDPFEKSDFFHRGKSKELTGFEARFKLYTNSNENIFPVAGRR